VTISGRDVLYALRDRERQVDAPERVHVADVAFGVTGKADGRPVARKLRRLERAGLVEKVESPFRDNASWWRTTERGRKVETLCSRYDARRGGEFAPLVDFLPDLHERLALTF
jgi:hypothetical protein